MEEGRKENITFLGQISLVLASILECAGRTGWGHGQLFPWDGDSVDLNGLLSKM